MEVYADRSKVSMRKFVLTYAFVLTASSPVPQHAVRFYQTIHLFSLQVGGISFTIMGQGQPI